MVIQSLAVTVLNGLLGTYIENLDASQLNLGVWQGNLELNNLVLKQSIFDTVDSHIKLKYGFLTKLTLKIPWTGLHTESWIIEIDGLYVLVVPKVGVKYDAKKEKKRALEIKLAELERIEYEQKTKRMLDAGETPKVDDFYEKMLINIVKNLQLNIRNVHFRYEDQYSSPDGPFVVGFTLRSLCFQTTDDRWNLGVNKSAGNIIYKLMKMECLSLYWNSYRTKGKGAGALKIADFTANEAIIEEMEHLIAKNEFRPAWFTYILNPINIDGKLRMNKKPETDGTNFKVPKISLTVTIPELQLLISKYQYKNLTEFIEARKRLELQAKYRKYRPNVKEYKKHYKDWWRYAATCILEEIRQKKRCCSLKNVLAHMKLLKKYKEAWVKKLTSKTLSKDIELTIQLAEETLDVFNLNLGRQRAELKVESESLPRVEHEKGWGEYITGMIWGEKKHAENMKQTVSRQIDALSNADRAKLYAVIDYKENQPPMTYPIEFIENQLILNLGILIVIVQDDEAVQQKRLGTLKIKYQNCSATINQRPAAKSDQITVKVQRITVQGVCDVLRSFLATKRVEQANERSKSHSD